MLWEHSILCVMMWNNTDGINIISSLTTYTHTTIAISCTAYKVPNWARSISSKNHVTLSRSFISKIESFSQELHIFPYLVNAVSLVRRTHCRSPHSSCHVAVEKRLGQWRSSLIKMRSSPHLAVIPFLFVLLIDKREK